MCEAQYALKNDTPLFAVETMIGANTPECLFI